MKIVLVRLDVKHLIGPWVESFFFLHSFGEVLAHGVDRDDIFVPDVILFRLILTAVFTLLLGLAVNQILHSEWVFLPLGALAGLQWILRFGLETVLESLLDIAIVGKFYIVCQILKPFYLALLFHFFFETFELTLFTLFRCLLVGRCEIGLWVTLHSAFDFS